MNKDCTSGCEFYGKSHDNGGITSSNLPVEVEGAEIGLDSGIKDLKEILTLSGTHKQILSEINVMGGGKKLYNSSGKPVALASGPVKLEGGQYIINKKSVADTSEYTYTGTAIEIISQINKKHGGVAIYKDGGWVLANGGEVNQEKKEQVSSRNVIKTGESGALSALESKLKGLINNQERMKLINKAYKAYKKKPESLSQFGLSESEEHVVKNWIPQYSSDRVPYPTWQLANNNANIKRVEGRIAEEQKLMDARDQGDKEYTFGDGTVTADVEANRWLIRFNGRPSDEVKAIIKRNGFKWSPKQFNAWVRNLNTMPESRMARMLEGFKLNESNSIEGDDEVEVTEDVEDIVTPYDNEVFERIQSIARKHKVLPEDIKAEWNKGVEVEKEHTNDEKMSSKIAFDHLEEFPDYYTRLKVMEDAAKADIEHPFPAKEFAFANHALVRMFTDEDKYSVEYKDIQDRISDAFDVLSIESDAPINAIHDYYRSKEAGKMIKDLVVSVNAELAKIKPKSAMFGREMEHEGDLEFPFVPLQLKKFMPEHQVKIVNENPEEFQGVIKDLMETILSMPKSYETDGQGNDAIVQLHYFSPSSDWYITERDAGEEKGIGDQLQAFGYTVLNGDTQNAELGYIPISSMLKYKNPKDRFVTIDLDFHWNKKTLGEVKGREAKRFVDNTATPQPKPMELGSDVLDVIYEDEVDNLQIATEYSLRQIKKKYPEANLKIEYFNDGRRNAARVYMDETPFTLSTPKVEPDNKLNYMMLSRLMRDVEYFMGSGGGSERHLHEGSVGAQIAEMKRLWNSLPEDGKPDWLSLADIDRYEYVMTNRLAPESVPLQSEPKKQEELKSEIWDKLKGIGWDTEGDKVRFWDEDNGKYLVAFIKAYDPEYAARLSVVTPITDFGKKWYLMKGGDNVTEEELLDWAVKTDGKAPQVIGLTSLDDVPLSTQLRKLTGSSFNSVDFHNLGDENNLQTTGIIVHRKTGLRFRVPESQTERFGLRPTKSVDDLSDNIMSILNEYSNREMGAIQSVKYLSEHRDLAKQYLAENDLNSLAEFKAHAAKIHVKARAGIRAEKKAVNDRFNEMKTEVHLDNIMNQAFIESEEMDRRVAEYDKQQKAAPTIKATTNDAIRYFIDQGFIEDLNSDMELYIRALIDFTKSHAYTPEVDEAVDYLEVSGFKDDLSTDARNYADILINHALDNKPTAAEPTYVKPEMEEYKFTFYGAGKKEGGEKVTIWYNGDIGAYYSENGVKTTAGINKYIETNGPKFTLFGLTEITKAEADLWTGKSKPEANVLVIEEGFFQGLEHEYKNQFELNKAIEEFTNSKDGEFNADELEFIRKYAGYGGLEKFGGTAEELGKGWLYEYYTPDALVRKMWGLAYKHGYHNGPILEPSVGVGNFLQYAPEGSTVVGYEISKHSAAICQALYPDATIHRGSFESLFVKRNLSIRGKIENLPKFSLVIGNPPYGLWDSGYKTMGEDKYTHANNWIEYFIFRGLDLLEKGGLLVFVVGASIQNGGTLFLDKGASKCKQMIADKAELVDAYRLPEGVFPTTKVTSDIIVLKKL